MNPAQAETIFAVKSWLVWFLAVASLVAILALSVFAWLESIKVPEITFYGTPSSVAAVDIRGAVATPGVIYIHPGGRMIDVVDQAGGFTVEADQTLVNLSSRVNDGQLIVIPTQAPEGAVESEGTVNINTASVAELDQLPGIGTVRAEQIIVYREANGPFQSIDELVNVDGISANLVETLRPYIRVAGND